MNNNNKDFHNEGLSQHILQKNINKHIQQTLWTVVIVYVVADSLIEIAACHAVWLQWAFGENISTGHILDMFRVSFQH